MGDSRVLGAQSMVEKGYRPQWALPEDPWVLSSVGRDSTRLVKSRPLESQGWGWRPLPRVKGHYAEAKRQGPVQSGCITVFHKLVVTACSRITKSV